MYKMYKMLSNDYKDRILKVCQTDDKDETMWLDFGLTTIIVKNIIDKEYTIAIHHRVYPVGFMHGEICPDDVQVEVLKFMCDKEDVFNDVTDEIKRLFKMYTDVF